MEQDIESAAREMGWRPKEEFRGDPEKWVDAQTWVSRGENFIPILRADRDANRRRVDELSAQLAEQKRLFDESQAAIASLKEFQTEFTLQRVKDAKRDILKRLREARDSGETDIELRLEEELDELKTAEREAKAPTSAPTSAPAPAKAPAAPAAPADQKLDPELVAWEGRNAWFRESPRKRGLVMGIAEEIANDPSTKALRGRAFFDELDRRIAQEPLLSNQPRTSKVDGGRPSGGSGEGGGGGKTYADLPPEAKAACDSQGRYLVGPGKAYKDAKEWQAFYAKTYFETA